MAYQGKNQWALILGGSSGFGLASAQSLADLGLNLFIVHRDRRGAMASIDSAFEDIRKKGVKLVSFNTNALEAEGRNTVLSAMADQLNGGKVHTLLHSIALGNLKPIAPVAKQSDLPLKNLAAKLGVPVEKVKESVNALFVDGDVSFADLADTPVYDDTILIGEEDMSQTIYNMGTNLLTWVQQLHQRKMFAGDARVFGLTSEGNTVAWRGYAAVSAAKAALEAVSRSIAREYAPFGIRCNILQPGVTETKALNLIPGSAHLKASALKRNPFGRLTTPEDVGGLVALLSRPEAGWINGALIRVDGGEHISG
jgi:NAD(P)-dependent dehydrogenase (short-subunit alcohol dehydrogenase family)